MKDCTYILRFYHCDSSEIEEQEHSHSDIAWDCFRLFAEPGSSEIYSRIELTEYTWNTHTERRLAALEFTPA